MGGYHAIYRIYRLGGGEMKTCGKGVGIMNLKQLLRQYNSLIAEIGELEKEIRYLENLKPKFVKDKVTGSDNEFPFVERDFTISGVVEDDKLIKKRIILTERKEKCIILKIKIEEFISTIPDSLTRRIFKYRYVDGLEWLPISMKIGGYDESYARKKHDRYLEGFE